MAKAGNSNHRAKYQEYKNSGRREENKRIKQERSEKERERIRARREKNLDDNSNKRNKKPRNKKHEIPATPPYQHKLPIQKWTSVMRKLDNYLEDKKKTDKDRPINIGNQYPKHHKHDDIDAEE